MSNEILVKMYQITEASFSMYLVTHKKFMRCVLYLDGKAIEYLTISVVALNGRVESSSNAGGSTTSTIDVDDL